MTYQIVQAHVEKLIRFLTLHTKLSQAHMVDYFTCSLFETCIPLAIQKEINLLGYEQTIDMIFANRNAQDASELNHFIKTAKSCSLYNLNEICQSRKEFFTSLGFEDAAGYKLDVFMTSKKSHEVETLSVVARNVAQKCQTSHLVDIGDGKGYLSSLIAFQHKIPVLGVDGSYNNTENALKRAQRLERQWHRITSRIDSNNQHESNDDNKGKFYKQVTQLVTEETDFNELVNNVFLEDPQGIGLVGLHTCGNLGPTSLRIFNANKNIKSICNVSCCYHLLNENYLADTSMGSISNSKVGFPMSKYIQEKGFTLLRATRMLSAQSLDRILHHQILPSKVIFYRALLEILIGSINEKQKNVGKFRREPENFVEYAREATKRLGLNLHQSDLELEAFYERHTQFRKQLNVFHLIRSMLAPAIESLILLDRYLYLYEEGHKNVHLVKLFDPVISPRCYGLVSYR